MLAIGKEVRGPCKAMNPSGAMNPERMQRLVRLLEGERAADRLHIDRQNEVLQRQARLLQLCRQALGDETYEALKQQLLDS